MTTQVEHMTSILQDMDADGMEVESYEELAVEIIKRWNLIPERIVIEGTAWIQDEDDGVTRYFEILDNDQIEVGAYARIMSWDDQKRHIEVKPFEEAGRNIRVTMELA